MQAIEKEELNFSADNALYGKSESRHMDCCSWPG